MKLLNREPTEKMIEAACAVKGISFRTWWIDHFQAMYDAAPNISIDMEPVAWMLTNRHGTHFGNADNAMRPDSVNLYSAEQLEAKLKAEREACAAIIENIDDFGLMDKFDLAALIRARGL